MLVLAIGCLALAAGLQIYYGLLNVDPVGHDSHLHPMWLEMFARQVANGNPSPRWLTGTYGAFGSPTFYFYPPLTYYLGWLFSIIGVAETGKALFHAVQITGSLLAAGTAYSLLRDQGAPRLSTIACALLFAYSPYSFVDVFSRSALSEYLAIAWLPVLFAGTMRVIQGRKHGWSITVLGWTLLLLTSMPAACCALVGWIAFIFAAPERSPRSIFTLVGCLLLAAAISACYLLPAISLSSLINIDRYHSASEINVIKAMVVKSKLGITLRLGVMLILAISCYQLFVNRRTLRSIAPWSALLMVAIVFQLPFISDWLYSTLQPFKMIRFPWRLTMLGVLGLTVLLSRSQFSSSLQVLSIALLSLVFYSAYGLNHVMTGERTPLHVAKRDAPEYITRYVPLDDSAVMKFIQENEHAPVISSQEPSLMVEAAIVHENGIDAEVRSSIPATLTLHQFYWPYWKVRLNGKDLITKPDANGLLTAEIPAGQGHMTARIERASVEIIGAIISLAALCTCALLYIIAGRCVTGTRQDRVA